MCSTSPISSHGRELPRKSNRRELRFIRDKIIVDKMLRYVNKVCEYCKGVSYEDFRANDMLIEACMFNLGQIGELTTKLGKH